MVEEGDVVLTNQSIKQLINQSLNTRCAVQVNDMVLSQQSINRLINQSINQHFTRYR